MTKVVTASEVVTMTSGQIGKIQHMLGTALSKLWLPKESTQEVLETQGDLLMVELVAVCRKRIKATSRRLVVDVEVVDRQRSPHEALAATGCRIDYAFDSLEYELSQTMPRGDGKGTNLIFFESHAVTDAQVRKEYKWHGLVPADPYSLAAANEKNPMLRRHHSNATVWKHDGEWWYLLFGNDDSASVGPSSNDWDGPWWRAGLNHQRSL